MYMYIHGEGVETYTLHLEIIYYLEIRISFVIYFFRECSVSAKVSNQYCTETHIVKCTYMYVTLYMYMYMYIHLCTVEPL